MDLQVRQKVQQPMHTKSDHHEDERSDKGDQTVFLDTNVLLNIARNEHENPFTKDVFSKYSFVINPVVLQEFILNSPAFKIDPHSFEWIKELKLIPINMEKVSEVLQKLKENHKRNIHSNDILIISSASDCDYFITEDRKLGAQFTGARPKILSSAEFEKMLGGHRL